MTKRTLIRHLPPASAMCLLSFVGLLSAGCFGPRFDALDASVATTKQDVAEIQEQEKRIEERLARLEEMSQEYITDLRLSRATEATRHQELLERLERLEALSVDSDDRVGYLAQQMDDARWHEMPPEEAVPGGEEATGEAAGEDRESGANAGETVDVPAPTVPGAEVRSVYEAARLDLTQGHYDLAASSFREFLSRFPNTQLSDNAQYWLGECFYAQKKFDEAFDEFRKVLTDYPRGDKVPAALLKMGYSRLNQGRAEEGISILKRVVSDHRGTSEADRALERLRSLAEEPGE